jgi:hypothetical protein
MIERRTSMAAIGVAVLDDDQHAALSLADWSSLNPRASTIIGGALLDVSRGPEGDLW